MDTSQTVRWTEFYELDKGYNLEVIKFNNRNNHILEIIPYFPAPQHDTRDETIAELMALKSKLTGDLVAERAKVATLREALHGIQNLTDQLDEDGRGEDVCLSETMRQYATEALAATGDE